MQITPKIYTGFLQQALPNERFLAAIWLQSKRQHLV